MKLAILFLIFSLTAQGQTPLQDMVKAEQAFSKAEEKTTREAFMAYIADDGLMFRPQVRLYRAGSLPFIGREASVAALARIEGHFRSKLINGDVSRAGDLGYTHGTYDLTDAAGKVIERGSYVRIWQTQDSVWRW